MDVRGGSQERKHLHEIKLSEGRNQQCLYCPENNVRSEVGTFFFLLLLTFYHRNKMAAEEGGKSKGSFKWKILEHLCKFGNNSEEWEDIVTQKKGGRTDEGNCWKKMRGNLRKRGKLAI